MLIMNRYYRTKKPLVKGLADIFYKFQPIFDFIILNIAT